MKLYFAQVFWKMDFNTTAYYTKRQLQDKRILHYSILEIIETDY